MVARELDEKDFDYVVYGTGLTESILAAALAHAGASVLHLDSNDFYGASSATFSVQALQKLENEKGQTAPKDAGGTQALDDYPEGSTLRSVPKPVLFPNGYRHLAPSISTQAVSEADSRRILVDISPRLLMSSGPMVDMMVGTKVGHYLDFRALDGIYLTFSDTECADSGSSGWGWKRVPASRADVFQDRFVTMLEKRLLMRYVKSASTALLGDEPEEESNIEHMSFEEHMKLAGLTDKLQALLLHGIVLGEKPAAEMTVPETKERILAFQKSLVRFPNTKTPFLYPNYGTAEIAQAFCRACAVQGGTYLLRRAVSNVASTADGELAGCMTDNNEFVKCKAVFAPAASHKNDTDIDNGERGVVWRCVCVLDSSLIADVKRALFVVPKDSLGNTTADVRITQIDSDFNTCPKGSFLLYAQTVGMAGTENDLVSALRNFVHFDIHDSDINVNKDDDTEKMPRVRWGIIYSRDIWAQPGLETMAGVQGVHLLAEGGVEADAEFCVKTAKIAFETVLPDAEFFGEKEEEAGVANERHESNVGDAQVTPSAAKEDAEINGAVTSPQGDANEVGKIETSTKKMNL